MSTPVLKLYELTNRKTRKKLARRFTETDLNLLRTTAQPHSQNLKMIDLYDVEAFEVPTKGGDTFVPKHIVKAMPAVSKEETKGLPAGGQNIDASESN